VILMAPAISEAGVRLYRYVNADGRVEISHTAPADRVSLGYEVIDSSAGGALEVVEAQKSSEELARMH
jgi:hypothetical protein